jgi:hypothetical protein
MTSALHPPWHQRLLARFDDAFLQAPDETRAHPAGADGLGLQAVVADLLRSADRFSSAHGALPASATDQAQQRQALDWQLLRLDGTLHLRSLGGPWSQRLHRLQLKVAETWGAGRVHLRAPGVDLPWDCGFVRDSPQAAQRAAQFTPRRSSLLVAWQLPSASSRAVAAALQARAEVFGHPVRLLVVAHGV